MLAPSWRVKLVQESLEPTLLGSWGGGGTPLGWRLRAKQRALSSALCSWSLGVSFPDRPRD